MRISILFIASFSIAVAAGLIIGVIRGIATRELPVSWLSAALLIPNFIGLAAVLHASEPATEPIGVILFAIATAALVSAVFGAIAVLGLLIAIPFRPNLSQAPPSMPTEP